MGHRYAATGSSDSHRIQYIWAGYPRTMVEVGEAASGEDGKRIDVASVVSAIKKGHSTVTSGPMIELEVRGARPGDELVVDGATVTAHMVVRAAPWIDVSSLEIVVGGKKMREIFIPSRPMQTGKEPGTREEAAARTVRYEGELDVEVPPESTWMLAIVRGTRAMDDVLPFMPVTPLAFTNPIWLSRAGRPMPIVSPLPPYGSPGTKVVR
jgi:hypothetical protein